MSDRYDIYYYIYRHMQEFWGASKAFFTEKWAYIYRNYGHENFFIMYILGKLWYALCSNILPRFSVTCPSSLPGTTIFGSLCYFFANIFFVILDVTGKPAVFRKYKIQENKNFPVRKLHYICASFSLSLSRLILLNTRSVLKLRCLIL